MSHVPLRVKAEKATQKMFDAGMLARVEIEFLSQDGTVLAVLQKGTLRQKDGRYWVSAPFETYEAGGQTKYVNHWYLFPNMESSQRDQWNNWVVSEILKVVGTPPQPEQNQGGYQQGGYQQQGTPQGYPPQQGGYPPQGGQQQGGYPAQPPVPPQAPAPQGPPHQQPPAPSYPQQFGYPQPPSPQGPPQVPQGSPPQQQPRPPQVPGEDSFPVPPMAP